ncbi:DUF2975 domain-containing protein [uncultured Adlercreutzia sp.]|uniref:DUF2975 domain-containing protein n=1 Tax=uncultured Adlercreutzia sp. TaxID=875803 RepID=UPI00266B84FB|nr:DUF2975 domain-containing protein [uncultured Adlercreutzia sp.]
MGESEERHIGDELCRVRKACRLIRSCSFVAMAVLLVFWAIVIIGSMAEQVSSGVFAVSTVVYMAAYAAFTTLILWNLTMLFQEVVKGNPPFSQVQADRLQTITIAIASLAYFVLELLISFGFVYEPDPSLGFGVAVNDGVDVPTININFGMLAFSAIMYSLSAIFRYAALLQQLSDETV